MANWDDYKKIFSKTYKGNSLESYSSYANKIEELYQTNYNQSIGDLINNAIIKKINDPVDWLLKRIDIEQLLMQIGDDPKKRSSYRCGFKNFAAVVFGVFYANTWMSLVTDDDVLCSIVAQNALFASKEVVEMVKQCKLGDNYTRSVTNPNNPFASWDYMTHYRDTKKKRKKVKKVYDPNYSDYFKKYPGIQQDMIPDDNTYANRFIKTAVLESIKIDYGIDLGSDSKIFRDYESCHVWNLPTDRRYYASIANLVLLPRALAQLTDHNDSVKNLLRCEVKKRFGFIPEGEKLPDDPNKNNKYNWRVLYKNQQYESL